MPILKIDHTVTTTAGNSWAYCHWRPKGEAPTGKVVMVHSLPFDRAMWNDLATHLCEQYGLEVYLLDMPGHGRSTEEVRHHDDDQFQAAFDDIVVSLQLSPYHYIGCSLGSECGLRASISHPDDVISLVTIGASPPAATEEQRQVARWNTREITANYSSIKAPVLVMCSANDRFFLPHAEQLFALLHQTQVRLELIPNSEHEDPIENPDFCWETVRSFYDEVLHMRPAVP